VLSTGARPVTMDRARLERQMLDLAPGHAAARVDDADHLTRMARLREQLDAVEVQRVHDPPAERALEWLEALAETWQTTDLAVQLTMAPRPPCGRSCRSPPTPGAARWRGPTRRSRCHSGHGSPYGTNRIDLTISCSAVLMSWGVSGKYWATITTRNPSTSMTVTSQVLFGPCT
jgi:hypothetical protein